MIPRPAKRTKLSGKEYQRPGTANVEQTSTNIGQVERTLAEEPASDHVPLVVHDSSNLFEDQLSTVSMDCPSLILTSVHAKESSIHQLIGGVVNQIIAAVCTGRMAASTYMNLWMRDLDAQRATADIVTALRHPTKKLLDALIDNQAVTCEDLLKIRGNVRDQSQGVYLDIITTASESFGLCTGGAAATLASFLLSRGLYRRIGKHLSLANRESHPCAHYEWINRPGNQANFVILAVFNTVAPKQLFYFTETVMTTLFGSFNDGVFCQIRPNLPSVGGVALNRDTPLRTELHADYNEKIAAKRAQGRRDGALKTAGIKQGRALQPSLKGGEVKLSAQNGRLRFKVLALPWICIPQQIAKSWGLKGGDMVNIVYNIKEDGMHKHKFAEDGIAADDGFSLGIKVLYDRKEA